MRIPEVLLVIAAWPCATAGPLPSSSLALPVPAVPARPRIAAPIAIRKPERLDFDLVRRAQEAKEGRFPVFRREDLREGGRGPASWERCRRPAVPAASGLGWTQRRRCRRASAGRGGRGRCPWSEGSNLVGPLTPVSEERPANDGGVVLGARSVLASGALCRSCPLDTSVGDSLGVVVDAFSKGSRRVATGRGG